MAGRADPIMHPFVWCSYGKEMLTYATWSIRSLARFEWPRIHVIATKRAELDMLRRRLRGWIADETELTMEIVPYPIREEWGGYFYKTYALGRSEHLRDTGFIYCDADVLIREDPRAVFETARGRLWFHKLDWNKVPEDQSEIGSTRGKPPGTSAYAVAAMLQRFGPVERLKWMVNSGFFQLPADCSREILEVWNRYIFSLDPATFFGDQEALTVVLHHLRLEPVCDKRANYAMARHYLADMKPLMVRDAVADGLDPDYLRLRLMLGRGSSAARAGLRRARRAGPRLRALLDRSS